MSTDVLPMFTTAAPSPETPEPDPATRWTEALLVAALRSRYGGADWALVTQVRDGAGWDRRTFDAVAIGLWQSRGHAIHGFECKVSKSDWKRELAQPQKAEPLAAFCDRWWIVAPRGVVDPSTLPETWGLLEARGLEGPIVTVVEAAKRDARPPTAGFVAQLAKRLLAERPAVAEMDAADERGYQRGKADGERAQRWDRDHSKSRLEALEERVRVFEEASGLSLRRLETARREAARFIGAVDAWQQEPKP